MVHLDDFLFASRLGSPDCRICMETFQSLAADLGVPLGEGGGLTTLLSFLGILIDIERELCVLPEDKVSELGFLVLHMPGKASHCVNGRPCWDI